MTQVCGTPPATRARLRAAADLFLRLSAARGDTDETSDYDLMVVVPDSAPAARRRSRIAYEALRGTRIAADVLVCTESYFDRRGHLVASLPERFSERGGCSMPPDPVRAQEAQAWLERARADLRATEVDLAAEPAPAEDAAFHCQQVAEKTLKGFLAWHDLPFRKTHSIEELGEQCLALDERLRDDVDRAVPLTEFAWRFRYPGDTEELTPAEAAAALEVAGALDEAVAALLPHEARP